MNCALCGRSAVVERLGLVRCAEMDPDGEVVFVRREVCPRCVGERGVVMPSRTLREMVEAAIGRIHAHVLREVS